jgi:type I restriction enzyme S subunit
MSKHCTLKVPEDWEIVKLGDGKIVEDIYYGITAKAVDKNTGLRILRTTDIKNYSVDWDSLPYCEITEKRNDISKYLLKKGDLIVARAGTIGVSVLVEKDFDNIVFGSYLIKIKLKPDINPKFIHYFFQSSAYWNQIKKAQGSTLKNLNIPLLSSLQIFIPPAIEQQKIAEILSTIDGAIQKTNVIITKAERLKKGLMKELLTGRIRVEEKDGKIVFRKETEFKDTEIGRIPKDWEVVKLSEITTKIKDIDHKMPKKEETGMPFVSIKCMLKYPDLNFYLDFKDPDLEFISKEDYEYHAQRFNVEMGDIIYSRFGSIGNAKLVMTDQPFIASYSIVLIKPNRFKVDSIFLTCMMNSERVKKQAKSAIKGATNRNLHLEDIKNFIIPLPPLSEQQKIAEILSTIDKKLELERKRKEKLERIKKGLMDLLLTGKIRIRVNE